MSRRCRAPAPSVCHPPEHACTSTPVRANVIASGESRCFLATVPLCSSTAASPTRRSHPDRSCGPRTIISAHATRSEEAHDLSAGQGAMTGFFKWERVWDGLFWRFIHKRQDFFKDNPRTSMMYHIYNRMPNEKKMIHIRNAEKFIEKIT